MLIHTSIEALIVMRWIDHGKTTGNRDLVRMGLDRYIQTRRAVHASSMLGMPMVMGMALPVDRMRRGVTALQLAANEPEAFKEIAAQAKVGLEGKRQEEASAAS